MTTRWFFSLLSLALLIQSPLVTAETGTGLEIDNPQQLNVVLMLEPETRDQNHINTMIAGFLDAANIHRSDRQDAQLFLRVEQQASEYLLYLDFSRTITYHANGQCYTKDGFVWGRYVKDIHNLDDLYDDVELTFEAFIEAYTAANHL